MSALQEWCNKGYNLIACLDANDDVYKNQLGKHQLIDMG